MPNANIETALGIEGRFISSHPVWDSLHEEIEEGGELWLSDLVRWYEADWLLALDGGPRPTAANVLQRIQSDKRPLVEQAFASIDTRYSPVVDRREAAPMTAGESSRAIHPEEECETSAVISAASSTTSEVSHQTPATGEPITSTAENSATLDYAIDYQSKRARVADGESVSKFSSVKGLPELPGYKLQRELGRGGMGVVYLAHQEGVERPVAIKMIIGGHFITKEHVARFKAEARSVGKLQHENIVRIYEIGWHNDLPYVALEYIDGPTLSKKIASQPMEPEEAVHIAMPLAKSLAYAHQCGIVHRDLKPSNVLLTSAGSPKLSDFGLAKQLEADNEYSRTGEIVGTPGYMAPEQARGQRDIGPPADIYGLGAILYCMLTGRPPFSAAKNSDAILQLLSQDPVPPSRLHPSVPRDLETICLKCLEKEPGNRYRSVEEVHDDLRRFANHEPIAARPISKVERTWRWAKRKPMFAGLSLLAASLALMLMIGGPILATVIAGQKKDIEIAKSQSDESARQAIKAQAEAEKQQKIAQDNAQAAEESKLQAEQSAQLAQSQNRIALAVLRQVTFSIDRQLKDRPRMQTLRNELIDAVTKALDDTNKLGFDPHAQDMIAAGTYSNLGHLNVDIGRADAALSYFLKVAEIFQQMEKQGTPPTLRNKSQIYVYLANACMLAGKNDEAIEYSKESLKIRQAWLQSDPTNVDVEQNVAGSYGDLGNATFAAGRLEEARDWYEKSLVMREKWVQVSPDSLNAETQLAGARWSMARVAFQAGQWETAIAQQQEQIGSLKRLQQAQNGVQGPIWNVAKAIGELGMMQLYLDRLSEASANYAQSVAMLRELVAEDPENFSLKEDLAQNLYGQATVELHQSHNDQARELYNQSLELRRELTQFDTENLRRKIGLALGLARANQADEARLLADSLLPRVNQDARAQYDLAGVYAQIGRALQESSKKESPEVKSTLDQARQLIENAKAAGYTRVADLQRDPDLRPLNP